MAKKTSTEKKIIKNIDEFEEEFLPKMRQRKLVEAEGEEGTAFARRLSSSIFDNIREELAR